MFRVRLLLLVAFSSVYGRAQDTSAAIQIRGYLKSMATVVNTHPLLAPYNPNRTETYADYLLHNRVDWSWNQGPWRAGIGLRNRIFWGANALYSPAFPSAVGQDNGLLDLSLTTDANAAAILVSNLDRLWGEWEKGNWRIRAGRQRINWGIHTIWNPHDVFNQYNFLDFDYEERPGSDAVWATWFPSSLSSLDLAWAPGRSSSQHIAAARYRFNWKSTDWQIVAGKFQTDWTLGIGWAANLWQTSFKGEISSFLPSSSTAEPNHLAALSADYLFSNSVYLTVGYLYNQSPALLNFAQPNNLSNTQPFSAKNPWPFTHTGLLQITYPAHPLISLSLTGMVELQGKIAVAVPTISYSLNQNLDILLAAQLFGSAMEQENQLQYLSSSTFLRLKYSF